MISKSNGSMKQMKGSSAKVHSAAGSGSRPGKSAMKIPTSAPKEPHKLGRAPPGYLK